MFFFFNDTATTEIYTLSLHDALPISIRSAVSTHAAPASASTTPTSRRSGRADGLSAAVVTRDRKSTRLNSSYANISYAVFCLKKKKNNTQDIKQVTQNRKIQS